MRNAFGSHPQLRGNALSTPPSGREWATSKTANVGGDRMNPKNRILPLPNAKQSSRRADELVEVRETSCP